MPYTRARDNNRCAVGVWLDAAAIHRAPGSFAEFAATARRIVIVFGAGAATVT